jgi:hypothetical protein
MAYEQMTDIMMPDIFWRGYDSAVRGWSVLVTAAFIMASTLVRLAYWLVHTVWEA